jgi:hypothetical protein
MIVRFLASRSGGAQEEVGRIIYEGSDVKAEGTFDHEAALQAVFGPEVPQSHIQIMMALHDCPRRFDGSHMRAEIVG